jgi:DNA-directed RNA polymerase I subunit RPA1
MLLADADVLRVNIEKKIRSNGESALTDLDRKMISKLNEELSKNFFKELLSKGLFKPSGKNCISLMTTSGAKGATVSSYHSHDTSPFYGKYLIEILTGKAIWL